MREFTHLPPKIRLRTKKNLITENCENHEMLYWTEQRGSRRTPQESEREEWERESKKNIFKEVFRLPSSSLIIEFEQVVLKPKARYRYLRCTFFLFLIPLSLSRYIDTPLMFDLISLSLSLAKKKIFIKMK